MRVLLLTSMLLIASVSSTTSTNKPSKDSEKGAGPKAGPGFTRAFSEFGQTGVFYDFTDYVPDLYAYSFDNVIRSACQTGLWFYYEQVEYNQLPGTVYWMHGIEFCADLPVAYADSTSSLRYAGSPYSLNGDCFTLYQGSFFTGSEYWGDQDLYPTLDYMNDDASSLVVNGLSPWTFFSGVDYSGYAVCVYPNTDHDIASDGTTIDFGIYGTMDDLSFADNSISSAAKGCFTRNVVRSGKSLTASIRAENGAAGVIDVTQQ